MRIGIITMHKVLNFGSALQAYALQQAIADLGYDSEIIDYVMAVHKQSFKQKIKSLLCDIRDVFRGNPEKKRKEKFASFYTDYLRLSKHSYNRQEELKSISDTYDCYITGSDQVWNPIHIQTDSSYLLPFVDDGKYMFSYAPSFSKAIIDDEHLPMFERYLPRYNAISVRELSGYDIVKKTTGKDAVVVCDPTLLIERMHWLTMSGTSHNEKRKYILVYLLKYAYNPFPEVNSIIDRLAAEMDAEVIVLNPPHGIKLSCKHSMVYDAGPKDFLHLFSNASFIITSSFHGTAFAINLNKDFISVVSNDTKFDTRMRDLLKSIGLESRGVVYNNFDELYPKIIDWISVNKKLNIIRKEAVDFLKKQLNEADAFIKKNRYETINSCSNVE